MPVLAQDRMGNCKRCCMAKPGFTVDGTGLCMTDNLTGLMWVRTPDSALRTWATALTYANGLSICGYDDWRLPNVNELESLINVEQTNSAAWLNTQGFSNVQAGYWSVYLCRLSSPRMGCPYVRRQYGGLRKTITNYVWPVWGGTP